jgi:predicted CopG family antitoxin
MALRRINYLNSRNNVDNVVDVSYKTIKIRDETYESINIFIADLIKELKRPVSMDEALRYLLKCRKNRPSKFAGGWKMDDEEVEKIKSELKESWRRWEL